MKKILNKNKKLKKTYQISNYRQNFLNKKIISFNPLHAGFSISNYADTDTQQTEETKVEQTKKNPPKHPLIKRYANIELITYCLSILLSLTSFILLGKNCSELINTDKDCDFRIRNHLDKKYWGLYLKTYSVYFACLFFVTAVNELFANSLNECIKRANNVVNENSNERNNTMHTAQKRLFKLTTLNTVVNAILPGIFYGIISPDYMAIINGFKDDNCWESEYKDSFNESITIFRMAGITTILFPTELIVLYIVLYKKVEAFKDALLKGGYERLLSHEISGANSETERTQTNDIEMRSF